MGKQAMQMALALMPAPAPSAAEASDIIVKGKLIVRSSSGPLTARR